MSLVSVSKLDDSQEDDEDGDGDEMGYSSMQSNS